MADIFISYSREDRTRVEPIAALLEQQGWSVWWDRRLVGGEEFDTVIERELTAAKCVVVVWSAKSVESRWVRTEANEGMQSNRLVPVSIDDAQPPLAFRLLQTEPLRAWNGTPRDEAALRIVMAVSSRIDAAPPAPLATPAAVPALQAEQKLKPDKSYKDALFIYLKLMSQYGRNHERSPPPTDEVAGYFKQIAEFEPPRRSLLFLADRYSMAREGSFGLSSALWDTAKLSLRIGMDKLGIGTPDPIDLPEERIFRHFNDQVGWRTVTHFLLARDLLVDFSINRFRSHLEQRGMDDAEARTPSDMGYAKLRALAWRAVAEVHLKFSADSLFVDADEAFDALVYHMKNPKVR